MDRQTDGIGIAKGSTMHWSASVAKKVKLYDTLAAIPNKPNATQQRYGQEYSVSFFWLTVYKRLLNPDMH